MDRFWFLTSTTYGTWLPGDWRGFVAHVPNSAGQATIHNMPGEPYDAGLPWLEQSAKTRLKGSPIRFTQAHADELWKQFQETAAYRGWLILATGIMDSHFHMVVGVEGDPDPERVLGDFKAYGSRALNRRWGQPAAGTWWTSSGSKRKLPDEASILAAIEYVKHQKGALLLRVHPDYI